MKWGGKNMAVVVSDFTSGLELPRKAYRDNIVNCPKKRIRITL